MWDAVTRDEATVQAAIYLAAALGDLVWRSVTERQPPVPGDNYTSP